MSKRFNFLIKSLTLTVLIFSIFKEQVSYQKSITLQHFLFMFLLSTFTKIYRTVSSTIMGRKNIVKKTEKTKI